MIKTCREIAEDIAALRRKLQQDKLIKNASEYFSDKRKCESNNASVMCSNCNCWKSSREYSS